MSNSSGNANFTGTQPVIPNRLQALNVSDKFSSSLVWGRDKLLDPQHTTLLGAATIPATTTARSFCYFSYRGKPVQLPTGAVVTSFYVGANATGTTSNGFDTTLYTLGLGTGGAATPVVVLATALPTAAFSASGSTYFGYTGGNTGPDTLGNNILALNVPSGCSGGSAKISLTYVTPPNIVPQ